MRKLSKKSGQSVAEYFLIMAVVLTAVLAVGFLGRIQTAFGSYFNKAAGTISGSAN